MSAGVSTRVRVETVIVGTDGDGASPVGVSTVPSTRIQVLSGSSAAASAAGPRRCRRPSCASAAQQKIVIRARSVPLSPLGEADDGDQP